MKNVISTADQPAGQATSPLSRRLRRWLFSLSGPSLGLTFVLTFAAAVLIANGQLENFLTARNLQNLLHSSAVPAVAALGMLLVIISGGIDLSVGAVVALVTVVTMQVYNHLAGETGSPLAASLGGVLAGMVTGGVCGLCNGVTITRLKISPFLATLGMMGIARGLAFWLSGRTRIAFEGPEPAWVEVLYTARVKYTLVDAGVWSFVLLAILVALLLRYTVLGRYIYAVGSSEPTARLCGIDVERTKLALYGLAGLFAGWAGILRFAHTTSGDPNTGDGLELEVIAAVVLGGASLSGGRGTVTGTIMGVLMLGILVNCVGFIQVPVEVKFILIGAVVILNTALARLQYRQRE
jgi:ribose transport system permease protein